MADAEVSQVLKMLEAGSCAGVILLRRNCQSPDQISRLSRAFRDAAGDLAPIISIDQEGGQVARLDSSNGFSQWMSASEAALSDMSIMELEEYWTSRAWQLSEVGINLNFAPVVDLNVNPENPIIGHLGRSFGRDPSNVVSFAGAFVRAHHSAGIKTSLKHFPGHGSSTTDTHKEVGDISSTWSPLEMQPFADLVEAGLADSVMTSHLLHEDFSDEPWIPASLSWRAVRTIREVLGFKGAIFCDDMQMAAIVEILPAEDAALAAVNAGNTFLIFSNYDDKHNVDTVKRVGSFLSANGDRMDATELLDQISLERAFRADLR